MAQAQPTPELHRIASAIDALLPQTQCAQCGYAACEPYAHAIASGEAEINRCPPGGKTLIAELAAMHDEKVSAPALAYANRLSDFLFVAARRANDNGAGDVLWVPGANR